MNLNWEYWLGIIASNWKLWLEILALVLAVAWAIYLIYKEWRFSRISEFYIHKITDLKGIKSRYITDLWEKKEIRPSIRLAIIPDSNFIMLKGIGGSGKTHTMIDYVEDLSEKYRWYNRKAKVFIPKCPKSFTGISTEKIPRKINRDVILLWDDLHIGFKEVQSRFEDVVRVLENACQKKKFILIATVRSEDFEKLEKEEFLTHNLYRQFETQELRNLDEKTVLELTDICLESFDLHLTEELHTEFINKTMSAQPIPGYIVSALKKLKDTSKEKELTINDIHELEDDIQKLWLRYYKKYDSDRRRLIETIKMFRMYKFYIKLEYVERVCTQYFKVERNSYNEAFNALKGIWFNLRSDKLETWDAQYEGISIEKDEKLLSDIYRIIIDEPLIDDYWVSHSSYNLGVTFGELDEFEKAIECYDRALKTNPRFTGAWNNKGVALRRLEKPEEAIECYDRALKINPRFVEGLYNKGVALGILGKHEEAIECYDRALKINPKYAEAWNNKGIVLGELGKHKEAIECYDEALWINPRKAETWYNKSNALRELGKYEETIECCDEALKINPRYVEAWSNKGVVLGELDKHEEAIECYDEALKISPKYAKVWLVKGAILSLLGRDEEAQRCFENVRELDEKLFRKYFKNEK